MNALFEIAGGSIAGQAHVAAGRNNQDAFCWVQDDAGLVAVVCDGCSSGAHSEVGAQIGARLVCQSLAALLAAERDLPTLLERARMDVLARLRLLATAMNARAATSSGSGLVSDLSQSVLDYFLFTVVGVIVSITHATPFSLGDGLILLNGERRRLGPFVDNEPPYLGYGLLPRSSSSTSSSRWTFQIHEAIPVEELDSLLVGTDGAVDLEALVDRTVYGRDESVGPLSQFWTDDRFFRNSDMVRRRLTVINRGPRGGLLPDDTTVVAVRRKLGGA